MKQTILIAEDEADIRNILRLYLESENYEVLEAADGESAVAAVRNGSPDLVILDIMMPKLDGFAVVRAIRQQSDIPVLILSGADFHPGSAQRSHQRRILRKRRQHHDGAYLQAAGKDRGQPPQACPSGHCERIGVPL